MQIFVKLINGVMAYDITEMNDKGIYLKRAIADNLGFEEKDRIRIYDMRLLYAGRAIEDNDKISDTVPKEGTVHLVYRVPSGIRGYLCEYNNVLIGPHTIDVNYSPKDTVIEIIRYVIEILIYQNKIDFQIISSDAHLKLGDRVLDSWRHIAEYPELARSYFCYNLQDDFINHNSIFKPLVKSFGDYYQMILLGERTATTEQLELILEKPPTIKQVNYDCTMCDKQFGVILPCCRKRCCYNCLQKCTNTNNCLLCTASFN